jgi:hypothetical protein
MMGSRGAAVLSLLFLLTGCVGFTLAKGGEKLDLGDGIAVRPAQDWNRLTVSKFEYWTLDGLDLQNILFIKGAADGERIAPSSLAQHRDPEEEAFPKFRKGMSFLEVRELFEATLAREKAQKVVITDVAPAKFGGQDGFRFDFTFQNVHGLDHLGTATGTIFKDRLYMAVYRGTKLHFYDRHKRDFDQILGSLTFTEKTGIF